MQQELRGVYDGSGAPILDLACHISAIDARDDIGATDHKEIEIRYTLADQLYVDPQPAILSDYTNLDQRITMTAQEVAVARSHIAVWKRIASGEDEYTLVLEDDVFFRRDFGTYANQAWSDLKDAYGRSLGFDILYLSYREVRTRARKSDITDFVFRVYCGLWHLSGYVLTKKGAKKLLSRLPVRGPVDMWINHQCETLEAFATSKSVIDQRWDNRSDNLYSVLPMLSKIGVLEDGKPVLLAMTELKKPVFATGPHGAGMTSLAMALSMLGYRCCSDITDLPINERRRLFRRSRGRVFDAYVNVGSLQGHFEELANSYPEAKFIVVPEAENDFAALNGGTAIGGSVFAHAGRRSDIRFIRRFHCSPHRLLILRQNGPRRWKSICDFLECAPPISPYPSLIDVPQRQLSSAGVVNCRATFPRTRRLKFDVLPWIVAGDRNWIGVPSNGHRDLSVVNQGCILAERFESLDDSMWSLRNDTFPSNLALFRSTNFSTAPDGSGTLRINKERSGVRNYSSGAICSRRAFLYGRFEAAIKPANSPGLITGMFLHRNGPRQEIDMELLGKDTTKLLLNVYYNPGSEGATFEYGYRGTPVLIDLGFDASKDFHHYRIEWFSSVIRWFVDDQLVHERFNWEPTPIPHLPMQFHVNLWPSRSVQLAGRLSDEILPAVSAIRTIRLEPSAAWPGC
jgi:GR25 family glycosyltransferase involved in LPS biosynthesis